jgi:sec-independent protein translocase protein TatA
MLPNIGMGELIIILLVVLIFFGAKRLPDLAKGLGRSIKAFKDGMNESSNSSDADKDKHDKGN